MGNEVVACRLGMDVCGMDSTKARIVADNTGTEISADSIS